MKPEMAPAPLIILGAYSLIHKRFTQLTGFLFGGIALFSDRLILAGWWVPAWSWHGKIWVGISWLNRWLALFISPVLDWWKIQEFVMPLFSGEMTFTMPKMA
jgi:hypothetical protein